MIRLLFQFLCEETCNTECTIQLRVRSIIVQRSFGDLTGLTSTDLSLSTQSGTFKKHVVMYYKMYTFIIVPAIAEHQLTQGRQHKR